MLRWVTTMQKLKPIFAVLSLAALLATTAVIQTQGKAYEQKYGEWRIAFSGIQQTEGVKVSIKADGSSVSIEGTPANLGVIFQARSGAFQAKQKVVAEGKTTRLILQEPVVITVRSKGNELMKINASKADIVYEKTPGRAR